MPTSLRLGIVLSALTLVPLAAQIHVDAAANPGGNGQTWGTAYNSLQSALAAASPGQSVWVAGGTYTGGFVIPDGVTLIGGFAAGARRADQARAIDNPTVLDGTSSQRVVLLGDGCTLDGFVVQNGDGPAPGGGGALLNGGTATIRRCVFTNNRNSDGRGSALTIVALGDALVSDCVFHHNADTGHTIDVYLGGQGTFDHLTVVDNAHNGMHMQQGSVCVIENSIFARNSGRGICDVLSGPGNTPTLRNNLFWQNSVSLMHVQGVELQTIAQVNALPYASGNVAADPRFTGGTDYTVLPNSGTIDAALPGIDPRLDLGGMPRVTDGDLDGTMVADIGAHEFNNCVLSSTGSATSGSTITLQVDAASAFGGVALLLPGPTTTVAPFGTAYGTSPITAILGFLPGSLPVSIPPGFAADLVFQGFCFSGTSNGNFSNPLAVAIQ